jgi:hypothetical protein
MSDAAAELIHTFTTLSPAEQHAVLVALSGISEVDAGAISDEELTHAGAQIFSIYDAEESAGGQAEKG